MELIIDGNRGIYAPQEFCRKIFGTTGTLTERVPMNERRGCSIKDINTVLEGPGLDNEYYWECWNNIVENFNDMGKLIYEDQDIWLATHRELLDLE